jgi:hypothetical protein
MSAPKPVGWITPEGVLFPLAAYNPVHPSPYDGHKAGWEYVYRGEKPAAPVVLSPKALAEAQKFGDGMPEVFLEPSEPQL